MPKIFMCTVYVSLCFSYVIPYVLFNRTVYIVSKVIVTFTSRHARAACRKKRTLFSFPSSSPLSSSLYFFLLLLPAAAVTPTDETEKSITQLQRILCMH